MAKNKGILAARHDILQTLPATTMYCPKCEYSFFVDPVHISNCGFKHATFSCPSCMADSYIFKQNGVLKIESTMNLDGPFETTPIQFESDKGFFSDEDYEKAFEAVFCNPNKLIVPDQQKK